MVEIFYTNIYYKINSTYISNNLKLSNYRNWKTLFTYKINIIIIMGEAI